MRIECHECEHHECFDCPVAIESETVVYGFKFNETPITDRPSQQED